MKSLKQIYEQDIYHKNPRRNLETFGEILSIFQKLNALYNHDTLNEFAEHFHAQDSDDITDKYLQNLINEGKVIEDLERVISLTKGE